MPGEWRKKKPESGSLGISGRTGRKRHRFARDGKRKSHIEASKPQDWSRTKQGAIPVGKHIQGQKGKRMRLGRKGKEQTDSSGVSTQTQMQRKEERGWRVGGGTHTCRKAPRQEAGT